MFVLEYKKKDSSIKNIVRKNINIIVLPVKKVCNKQSFRISVKVLTLNSSQLIKCITILNRFLKNTKLFQLS